MARDFGVIAEDSSLVLIFTTNAADGGREDFSSVLEDADVVFVKDGTVATITSTLTHTLTFNSDTGVYKLVIDTSGDSDFTLGSDWTVYAHPDETIDTQSIAAILCYFRIETAAEKALRLYRTYFYPKDPTVSTTTNNSTTSINLTEILDAQQSILVGELLGVRDATNDQTITVRVTAFAFPQATVETLEGAAMPFTVAAGDNIWRVGVDPKYGTARALMDTALTESYAPDGAAGTAAQILYLIQQALTEFSVSSTTMTIKKLDGSTTAATETLDSATAPTSLTRAT